MTAVELVKYNLEIQKSKKSSVKAYQGNALNLSRFAEDQFDLVLVFGPMYHLYTMEDKVQALKEAKRVVKPERCDFSGVLHERVQYFHIRIKGRPYARKYP